MRQTARQKAKHLALALIFSSQAACVSVELPKKAPVTRNADVTYVAPGAPFVELKTEDLDRGWRNPRNGNSISFISECNSPVDPTLENIYAGIIKGVQNVESLRREKIHYNGREALRAVAIGDVDGVSSKIDFLIFKKNGCNYVLTYVALVSTFEQNTADFEKFVAGFKAP